MKRFEVEVGTVCSETIGQLPIRRPILQALFGHGKQFVPKNGPREEIIVARIADERRNRELLGALGAFLKSQNRGIALRSEYILQFLGERVSGRRGTVPSRSSRDQP